MSKPKSIGAIFKTIWNEAKGAAKSVVSARTTGAKLSVIANFAFRTISNLVDIGAKVAQKAFEFKQTRSTKKQAHQTKPVEPRKTLRKPLVTNLTYVAPEPPAPPAKVHYMTTAMRNALEVTKAQSEKQEKAESERKARILNSQLPQPYKLGEEGEKIHTLNCVNVGCQEDGSFEIGNSYLIYLRNRFGNDPANCYSCRILKYNAEKADCISGQCEVCGSSVSQNAEDWIGYHKYKGKPTFSIFCNICDRNRQQARQVAHDRQIALSYRGNREGIRKFGMEHDDSDVQKAAKRLQLQSKFAKCHPIAFDDLVDISEGSFHNYHNHPVSDGNGNKESAYAHIRHHLDGSNEKIASLSGFENTESVIKYAHDVAQINDPSRIIDSDEDKDWAIVKVDLETGIKLVYHKIGSKWMLKTAFRKDYFDKELGRKVAYPKFESSVRFANEILGKPTSQYTNPYKKPNQKTR